MSEIDYELDYELSVEDLIDDIERDAPYLGQSVRGLARQLYQWVRNNHPVQTTSPLDEDEVIYRDLLSVAAYYQKTPLQVAQDILETVPQEHDEDL